MFGKPGKLHLLFLLLLAPARLAAVDFWFSPSDPTIVTNSDCGVISGTVGIPAIRRDRAGTRAPDLDAFVADRLHAGETLATPAGSLLEWTSGNNIAALLAPSSSVRLLGLRQYFDVEGNAAVRLDLELLSGELRVQVRLNENRPEAVLVGVNGVDVLVRRGDVCLEAGASVALRVLSGAASVKAPQADASGAFSLQAGQALENGAVAVMDGEAGDAARLRLPFTFEQARAALPPLPAASYAQEAP